MTTPTVTFGLLCCLQGFPGVAGVPGSNGLQASPPCMKKRVLIVTLLCACVQGFKGEIGVTGPHGSPGLKVLF